LFSRTDPERSRGILWVIFPGACCNINRFLLCIPRQLCYKVVDFNPKSGSFPEKKTDDTDDTKRIDFGISFGAGMNIPFGRRYYFSSELRHDFGLINATKIDSRTIKTNSLGIIYIGLHYKL
jgi:hypothetical protein